MQNPHSRPAGLFIRLLCIIFLVHPLCAEPALKDKIAQMIMVGFPPNSDFEDTLYYDIAYRNLGGVILMGYNIQSPIQVAALNARLQDHAATPLLIATDQEGGYIARLKGSNGFAATPTAYYLGSVLDNEDSTRFWADRMAEWLEHSGINVNLAPVADVNVNPSSPAIGYRERSYSADPHKVAEHTGWFASEFHERGIVTALKHFPGHGSAVGDSHLGFTDISTTWLEDELIPYRELISDGYTDMIMSAHLYNAHLDSVYPASLSERVITGILRDSLGFEGVVISDAMGMGAISENYGFEEAVLLAINAGTDILLYTGNRYNDVSLVAEVTRIILQNIDAGNLSEARINASYERIMALKDKIPVSIVSGGYLPETPYLLSAFPNPFNNRVKIRLSLHRHVYETVPIRIYSAAGHLVRNFDLPLRGYGDYEIAWDGTCSEGTPAPSGIYIYTATINGQVLSGKMALLK
jgi:beta-N-acetylhexosaminidase